MPEVYDPSPSASYSENYNLYREELKDSPTNQTPTKAPFLKSRRGAIAFIFFYIIMLLIIGIYYYGLSNQASNMIEYHFYREIFFSSMITLFIGLGALLLSFFKLMKIAFIIQIISVVLVILLMINIPLVFIAIVFGVLGANTAYQSSKRKKKGEPF